MRHRMAGSKLGRTSTHRQATLRNMAVSLFQHGQIVTTIPKAKALQPFVEKIVTKARGGDLHARRRVIQMLGRNHRAFDWMHVPKGADPAERERAEAMVDRAKSFFDIPNRNTVERNRYGELRKAPKIASHIVDNVAPRFEDRPGGYTRIIKLGKRRVGDQAEYCLIQFVGAEDGPEIGGNVSTRRKIADKRTAFAAELAGRFAKPEAEPAPADADTQEQAETEAQEPTDETADDQAADDAAEQTDEQKG